MSKTTTITCDVCHETKIDNTGHPDHGRKRLPLGWFVAAGELLVEVTPPREVFPMPHDLPQRSLKVIGKALDVPAEVMDAAANEDLDAARDAFQAEMDRRTQHKYTRCVVAHIDVCPNCNTPTDEAYVKVGRALSKALAKAAAEPEPGFGELAAVPGLA